MERARIERVKVKDDEMQEGWLNESSRVTVGGPRADTSRCRRGWNSSNLSMQKEYGTQMVAVAVVGGGGTFLIFVSRPCTASTVGGSSTLCFTPPIALLGVAKRSAISHGAVSRLSFPFSQSDSLCAPSDTAWQMCVFSWGKNKNRNSGRRLRGFPERRLP